MSEEESVKKFAEEYIKAREKGDNKWHLKNADTKAMWEHNIKAHKEMGWDYKETLEEFQKNFRTGLSLLKVDKNSLTIKSIKVEGDTAEVEIDLKGASSIGSPLQLSKKSGKWMYVMGCTWFF
ncbi:MAG: nuclear transport factor 2 family protein [Promethearchaeota archaeon]